METTSYKTMICAHCPVLGKNVALNLIKRMDAEKTVCVYRSCSAKLECEAPAHGECLLNREW